MKKIVPTFDEFINEGQSYGTKHLSSQGSSIGQILKSIKDLKKGKVYCIVDFGLNEWNGGWKLNIVSGDTYTFESILGAPNSKADTEDFSKDELEDLIKDKAIAIDNELY